MSKSNIIIWTLGHRNFSEIVARVADVAIGWIIRPISFVTNRNKSKWLIGNKTGWNDNSKYLHIYLSENEKNIHTIWIGKNKKERDYVRSKGLEAYRKWSIKGLYHSLTSGVFIFSSNISDINYWASGKSVKVNLWHGVGLKKLGMKESDIYNPNSLSAKIFTPYLYDNPSYFIGPSEMMAKHFADCYLLNKNQMLKLGYPRCEFILSDSNSINRIINKYEDKKTTELISYLDKYDKVYIYMPTFRDTQTDFIDASGIDFDKINDLMVKKNQILILKLHPATRISYDNLSKFSNILIIDKHIDIYPILPHTDVLITDYSSIYYDYILMKDKNVILFPFDYDDYIRNSRDLAFDYMTYACGKKAWNFKELLSTLSEEPNLEFSEREWIIEQFWGDNYNDACQKITDATKDMLNIH